MIFCRYHTRLKKTQLGKMKTVRCAICRRKCKNLKILTAHYLSEHSKFRITSQCIKYSLLQTPKIFLRNKQRQQLKAARHTNFQFKKLTLNNTETLYLKDEFQIICSQKKLVVGNNNNSLYLDLNFSDSENGTIDNQRKTNKSAKCKKNSRVYQKKLQHYRINIKKINDEGNGTFYTCTCSTFKMPKSNSVQNYGQNFVCDECGNTYHTETELSEHSSIHAVTCKFCNDTFPSKTILREHVKSHLLKIFVCYICQVEYFHKEHLKIHMDAHFEEQTLESVLDMERDYRTINYPFTSGSYINNINGILNYLTDNPDLHYQNPQFMKVICDLCYHEMYYGEYESHLQAVHYIYNF